MLAVPADFAHRPPVLIKDFVEAVVQEVEEEVVNGDYDIQKWAASELRQLQRSEPEAEDHNGNSINIELDNGGFVLRDGEPIVVVPPTRRGAANIRADIAWEFDGLFAEAGPLFGSDNDAFDTDDESNEFDGPLDPMTEPLPYSGEHTDAIALAPVFRDAEFMGTDAPLIPDDLVRMTITVTIPRTTLFRGEVVEEHLAVPGPLAASHASRFPKGGAILMSRRLRGKVCTCLRAADVPDTRDPTPAAKCTNPECGLPIWADKLADWRLTQRGEKLRAAKSAAEEFSLLRDRVVDYVNALLNRAVDAKMATLAPGTTFEVAPSTVDVHAYLARISAQFYSPHMTATVPTDGFPVAASVVSPVD